MNDKNAMTKTDSKIRFKATLFQPPPTAKLGSCARVAIPKRANAKLPTRETTTVKGAINGSPFPRATLEPDGQGRHWLRVNRYMREAAGAEAGDVVTVEIVPLGEEQEPRVPADLRKALAIAPKARALWSDITPTARRDWVLWIETAKLPETRTRRVKRACSMLAAGKRRVCCFDSYRARMEQLSLSKPGRGKEKKKA